MNTPVGVAAFGLQDSISNPAPFFQDEGLAPACVILPNSPLGAVEVAKATRKSRIHAGLQWPPDAVVQAGTPLRRVPIPLAWSMLVDAADRPAYWNGGHGVTISLAAILAAHIRGLLEPDKPQTADPSSQTHAEVEPTGPVVVAIPDHLDEYAQEALLSALKQDNPRQDFLLLWRPVAAAMSWLHAVRIPDYQADDWLLAAYLGADAIEFATFGLREAANEPYLLPLRHRPQNAPLLPGWEWCCALAEQVDPVCATDSGAFWQATTSFSELWAALARLPGKTLTSPRPWSTSTGWRYWNPPADMNQMAAACLVRKSEPMQRIIAGSCPIEGRRHIPTAQSWSDYLHSELTRTCQEQKGRLRGVILFGPLVPQELPDWLTTALPTLPHSSHPQPDSIWLPPMGQNPITQGTQLYGEHLAHGRPTYLDTLPGLYLLTESKGIQSWESLVEAREWEGGKEYGHVIANRFCLRNGIDNMAVYLCKETPERSLPDIVEDQKTSPLRKGKVIFPITPEHDVPLKVVTTIRPASGLAKVFFQPDSTQLHIIRPVTFEYANMASIPMSELPEPGLGWPEEVHITITTNQNLYNSSHFKKFLATNNETDDINFLDNLTQYINKRPNKVDENGLTASAIGNAIIAKVATKIESLYYNHKYMENEKNNFIVKASRLWGGTPKNIINDLESILKSNASFSNNLIEAASRCFTEPYQFKIFFRIAYKKFKMNDDRTNTVLARSVKNMLLYRNLSWKELDEDIANYFVFQSAKMFRKFISNNSRRQMNFYNTEHNIVNRQIFFQGASLFLNVLKYRQKNSYFMDPTNHGYEKKCRDFVEYLSESKKIFKIHDNYLKLINKIENYIYHKGNSGIITTIESEIESI